MDAPELKADSGGNVLRGVEQSFGPVGRFGSTAEAPGG